MASEPRRHRSMRLGIWYVCTKRQKGITHGSYDFPEAGAEGVGSLERRVPSQRAEETHYYQHTEICTEGVSMTIAFLEPHISVCGGIRRVIEISNRLFDRGHSVSWFIPDWVYDSGQLGGWMEQKFTVYPMSTIQKMHGPGKYDVVIFNEETQWSIARSFPAKARIYYALHWSVLHKDYNDIRNCYNGGFHIIANSNWTARAMLLETGAKPPVVNGAINPQVFHEVDGPKTTDILTYGASRLWKGKYIAEAVFDTLKDKGVTMQILGDNSGIPQSEMAKAYGSARCYLSTSWYEGWNWPGLEAMACGTPLVISDDGGSRDYAVDEHNCLVYPARDIEAATKCVLRVLGDTKLQSKLRTNGLKTVKERNWDTEITKFEGLLKGWVQ